MTHTHTHTNNTHTHTSNSHNVHTSFSTVNQLSAMCHSACAFPGSSSIFVFCNKELSNHCSYNAATTASSINIFTWVHSSVVRAADCRSAGPWFKSGCALHVMKQLTASLTSTQHSIQNLSACGPTSHM